MELIGITGKAGAGKTTFSEYLRANNEKDIGVIHLDDLITEIKLKYFKPFMKKNNKGEKIRVDSRLKKLIYKNKYIFLLFMKFRAKLIEPLLNKKIEELSRTKKIVILDDIFIKFHKVYDKLDKIFLVERPFKERRESVSKRDGISKEEVTAYDMAHHKGNYREIKQDSRVITIKNNGDREELKGKAREVYLETMLPQRESFLKRTNARIKESRKKTIEKMISSKGREER